MVLNSNSISLTTREPAVATRGEESKAPDSEGTPAEEETRQQQQQEKDQEQKRRQAEAEAEAEADEQKRQAERERETSIQIYQYRRSVPTAEGRVCFFS